MNNNWRDKEPTQAQLSFLEGLGYTGEVPPTRGEASDKIDQLKKNCHSLVYKQSQNNEPRSENDRLLKIPPLTQTAFVKIPFNPQTLHSAQEKINIYLSDGFRGIKIWDLYSNETTRGKIMLLAKGWDVGLVGQVEFVYVSYTDEGLNVAQEKINMSLSDGLQILGGWDVISNGIEIGNICILGKFGCTTSEDYD
jgi:hypothetical protein